MNIRLATQADAASVADYFEANKRHFQPWEPIRERGYYSEATLQQRLAEYERQHREGTAAHFIGLKDHEVVAHCALTNIIYGPLMACFMGYGVSKNHEGTGMMTQVCQVAINHAFMELGLNRIIANYMPRNERSGNLLKKLGFAEEGLARKYLKINGKWEDHVLTSLLNPNNL
ncbi:GNAT family N-acetyltransferase [Marinimicrobium sp. ABcell2]|uniref:GNAT family N-acetyltransferase n=1 Tax=Marinimicrobium sp. ABcell2 TaxID=3069751 RepID=UPI0027B6E83E|nr:GNAT family N-acetyltransferase [Marinimicrobium sp. ABcell2]MDQ2078405.1 GNAT family N-acetyltransferase [Marinimicrobium sp. ABcell2]